MLNKKELTEIAEKDYEKIYLYCLSHSSLDENDAHDVTQEVFLLLQEKSNTLNNTNIEAWLYSVASYKMKEFYRKKQRQQSYLSMDDEFSIAELIAVFDEYFPVTDDEIKDYIKLIIKTLTEKERVLFEKLFIEKKSYEQIAEELNITPNAVSLRAFRLRKKIKTEAAILLSVIGQLILKLFI